MNINFNFISYSGIPPLFKETLLPALTIQQKRIAAIAAIAFVCLAACYVILRNCTIKGTDLSDQKGPSDTPSDPINKTQEETIKKEEEARNKDHLHESPILKKGDENVLDNKALEEEQASNKQQEEQIKGEEDQLTQTPILEKVDDGEQEKVSKDELIHPLDQELTPEHWMMKPIELMQVIYGTAGPRGNWVFDGKEKYRKIIHAGSARLTLKMQLFQFFCKRVGLAEPISFSQEEFEGIYKSYIMLELSEKEWKEYIEPIHNMCKTHTSHVDLGALIERIKGELIEDPKKKTTIDKNEIMALAIYYGAIHSLQSNLMPT